MDSIENNSSVTDTVIVTSDKVNVTDRDIVEVIQKWLTDTVLLEFDVLPDLPIEIVILGSMKRLLIICPNHAISKYIKEMEPKPDNLPLNIGYSLVDGRATAAPKKYLELPPHETLFLVSPPASPPPEFDYSKCEGPPSSLTHPSHDEKQQHTTLREETLKEPGTYTLIDSKSGRITVDTCAQADRPVHMTLEQVRTAFPPKSMFDDED
ncbi:Rcn1p NDAI_0C03910 [Naumovozyma dairenensis CBS 421]|uniref:Calcipressin n=1 Tax=Naumovozyma dairenensis (strain ATCC 10597 / BCRC 20456 / CBS 421 / NBRC 0211 / NRRL Y-12639) TaxID=1071378 RepID=G0W8E0_NAUDC|nr:hypothetical protein NDAI_0C03910 [Naumovozyma dairenensis CBS 421]CCD24051.1 hypothetical protein NDAI_0C03910 [Naumovozyma dairenensis CBS 421]